MNPDIQRIAEKWADEFTRPGDFDRERHIEEATAALTELSALRDTQERELREKLEQTENMATEDVAYQNTHIIHKDQLIDSLRAELARRDEVEGELRAKLMDKDLVMVRMIKNKQRDIDGAIECGQALGLTDGDERSLIQAAKDLRTENASLRSRIGELEAQVEDARNQWLERDT